MKFLKKLFFAVTLGLLVAPSAHAAILPSCAAGSGVPPLSCFLELGISVTNWILGITGSLALLYFVYGGFLFLTSRGSMSQVEKGKTVLTQAVIGIIIIFGAYLAVNFLVANVLGAKFTTEIPKEATPVEQPKCEYCYCKSSSGSEVPQGTGSTEEACKTSCSGAQIGGQGGFTFSRCGSPPSGSQTGPMAPASVSSCQCICSDGYQENITEGDITYPAVSRCQARCALRPKGAIMQSCK